MGVIMWGVSPLYVTTAPAAIIRILAKILANGKGDLARDRLKESGVQNYEPMNRPNSLLALFLPNGSYYDMPKISIKPLAELFRAEGFKMLEKEGLIDDTFIVMIMK